MAPIGLVAPKSAPNRDNGIPLNPCRITWYNPSAGVGSCGWQCQDNDPVVAISKDMMGPISNGNSLCGRWMFIDSPMVKGVWAKVVDKYMRCAYWNLDVSPHIFQQLGWNLGQGNVPGEWRWV